MEYAADDINLGYRTALMFLNDENTLIDKLQLIVEIKPFEHPIHKHSKYHNHQGGVAFYMILKQLPTLVEITMNYEGNFNIITTTELGEAKVQDESAQTLVNFLHIFYINMLDDENTLLQNALDQHSYRKVAKKMHYRELFGGDYENS